MLTDQMTASDQTRKEKEFQENNTIRPAALFCDGVIFQRGIPIPLWGKAAPSRRIVCRLGETEAVTYSGPSGAFFLKLPPHHASAGLELFFSDGVSECHVRNVAVGEVFLLAGQSNMEYDLAQIPDTPLEKEPCPLRIFRVKPRAVPGGAEDVSGTWKTSESRIGFSALGYFFGVRISELQNVPVGLIDASRGGVGIESFMPEYELRQISFYRELLEEYETMRFQPASNPEPNAESFVSGERLLRVIHASQGILPSLPESLRNWNQPDCADAQWQEQELPDSWTHAGHPHPGLFLYRKRVTIPEHWLGKPLTLSLGACDRADVTSFNGIRIGATGDAAELNDWNTRRVYTVPAECNTERDALIAVQVAALCSVCTFGGLTGPSEAMFLACGEEKIPLTGIWKIREAADTGDLPMRRMLVTGAGEPKSFHMLYDNSICRIAPFALRAILWYQGEANTLCGAQHYERLLKCLIRSWRRLWPGQETVFLIFQLPGFQRPHAYSPYSQWAVIRDAQLKAALEESGIPPVVMTDCGDVRELHPPEKKRPGFRAAEMLDSIIRGGKLFAAPVCLSAEKHGKDAIVRFATYGESLTLGSEAPYCGIVGISHNGKVCPLPAAIDAPDRLRLRLPDDTIAEIACGWCDNPSLVKLGSTNGLPVFPFRLALIPAQKKDGEISP